MRVITWNLWWRFGPWQERQAAIVAELTRVDADIVLLQEVYADPAAGEDQAIDLAAALGMNSVATVTSSAAGDSAGGDAPRARFGNAILSRWPISSRAQMTLPGRQGRPTNRSGLLAIVEHPLGPQAVVTTHLDWRYDESSLRQRQLGALVDWIGDRWVELGSDVESDRPVILGGDLNAVPESDELRRLTGLAAPYGAADDLAEPEFGRPLLFTDAWAACGEGPGHTWTRENANSSDAQWPRRRLDYVMVSWPRPKPTGNPLHCELAGVEPIDGVVPSDHLAVVADFDDRPAFSDDL